MPPLVQVHGGVAQGIGNAFYERVVYDENGSGSHVDADVAIIVVGENPYAEMFGDIGDGKGQHTLNLSDKNVGIINAYMGKVPKVVLILVTGRPLVVTNEIDESDAFVVAWLPGSEGDGIADNLRRLCRHRGALPQALPQDSAGRLAREHDPGQ